MKFDRLCALLDQQSRVKLYIVTPNFCLCGYTGPSHRSAENLCVAVRASVRWVFASMDLLREEERSGTLLLTEAQPLVTRRIQTHRRHLRSHDVPEDYFSEAMAL